MAKQKLIFLGSSWGMTRFKNICDLTGIEIAGIVDRDYYGTTDKFYDIPVIGTEDTFFSENLEDIKNNYIFFIATQWEPTHQPANMRNREKRKYLINLVKELDLPCTNLVDPRAVVDPTCSFGKNVFVAALAVIDAKVIINDFVSVSSHAYVSHEVVLDENSVVQAFGFVCGKAHIKHDTFCGIHSTVLPGLTVENNCVIRPYTLIKEDLAANQIR